MGEQFKYSYEYMSMILTEYFKGQYPGKDLSFKLDRTQYRADSDFYYFVGTLTIYERTSALGRDVTFNHSYSYDDREMKDLIKQIFNGRLKREGNDLGVFAVNAEDTYMYVEVCTKERLDNFNRSIEIARKQMIYNKNR